MFVRHLIFAGLFATASFANAGTVEASSATIAPASFSTTTAAGPVEPKAFQSMIAGPGTWSAVSRLGDRTRESTMLFSQTGSTPTTLGSVSQGSATVGFTETASPGAEASIAAPVPTELATIVVGADAAAAADVIAPVALAAIPEPATGMLMLAGLLGAGFMTRRRK